MRKLGEAPKGRSPTVILRVTEETRAKLEKLAKRGKRGKTTVSGLVRRYIEEGIAREVKHG